MNRTRWIMFLVLLSSLFFYSFTGKNPNKSKSVSKTHILVHKVIAPVATRTNPYYIIIDKSDYELRVYDDQGWLATYPVVFGSNDMGDKLKEGDKKTPEGNFRIMLKKIHPKWGPEMLLDFPNKQTMDKFNDRKAKGIIPKNARPGDGIAIHATRPDEEWTVDHFQNWTDGCISLKYTEAKDLYSYIPVGTPVTIQK